MKHLFRSQRVVIQLFSRYILIFLLLEVLSACGQTSIHLSKNAGNGSYITANSFNELISKSSLIAIGQVIKKGDVINAARDIKDIAQPDPNIYIVGQVYVLQVDRYLKGNGGQTISIVQPEGILGESTQKNQTNIEEARSNYRYIPMALNKEYLVFLNPLVGFSKGEYYIGSIHPWRFDISNPEKVLPESPWDGANKVFPPQTLSALLYQIEHPEIIPILGTAINNYPPPGTPYP